MSFRSATSSDLEFAYQVRSAAFREYAEKIEAWDEAEQRALHDRRFATQEFRIVCSSRKDVGVVALVITEESVKLNQLFLLPEFQAKGIGRDCMLLLMEEAGQRGLAIRLRVLKGNPRARRFYERLGFDVMGESETHHEMAWNPAQKEAR